MTTKVGFIGLGVLGSAMAANLLKSDFEVVGYDIEPGIMETLGKEGMEAGTSPRDVAERSETIVTCLPNAQAMFTVFGGEDGIDKVSKPGQIIVEASTFAIDDKEKALEIAEAAGRIMLDCPVSGNRIMAVDKKLTCFGSGDEDAYQKAEPIIYGYANRTFYVGAFGAGMKMKFCGNILNLVHNSVAAEVMVLAQKSGLDPKLVHEVISGSGSSSAMFETRGALMVRNNYEHEGMSFMTPMKDSRLISDHAAKLYAPIPIYQAALQPYYSAMSHGLGDQDQSAVCRALEMAANCVRPEEED